MLGPSSAEARGQSRATSRSTPAKPARGQSRDGGAMGRGRPPTRIRRAVRARWRPGARHKPFCLVPLGRLEHLECRHVSRLGWSSHGRVHQIDVVSARVSRRESSEFDREIRVRAVGRHDQGRTTSSSGPHGVVELQVGLPSRARSNHKSRDLVGPRRCKRASSGSPPRARGRRADGAARQRGRTRVPRPGDARAFSKDARKRCAACKPSEYDDEARTRTCAQTGAINRRLVSDQVLSARQAAVRRSSGSSADAFPCEAARTGRSVLANGWISRNPRAHCCATPDDSLSTRNRHTRGE